MMHDSEEQADQLEKLNFNDVSLTKNGEKTTLGNKNTKNIKKQ